MSSPVQYTYLMFESHTVGSHLWQSARKGVVSRAQVINVLLTCTNLATHDVYSCREPDNALSAWKDQHSLAIHRNANGVSIVRLAQLWYLRNIDGEGNSVLNEPLRYYRATHRLVRDMR